MPATRLFVISDLHLGGTHPAAGEPEGRGFRLCTQVPLLTAFVNALPRPVRGGTVELVINGDVFDFLAEPAPGGGGGTQARGAAAGAWLPFRPAPEIALAALTDIVQREAPFFDALARFLRDGGRLTFMLGNHDIELSFPALRRALSHRLKAESRGLVFVIDGEAYTVGPVLIEHGNRYDPWNVVQHDALRRLRSMQSRNEAPADAGFTPPAGSHLVAGVMNPIKAEYPFVDLLKPENEAVLPILLALAPQYRQHVFAAARLAVTAHARPYGLQVLSRTAGDVSAAGIDGADAAQVDGRAAVESALAQQLPAHEWAAFAEQVLGRERDRYMTSGDISAAERTRTVWGWMQLLGQPGASPLERRIEPLRAALRAAAGNIDFRRDREHQRYLKPAQQLRHQGWRFVVFGHTHLAKCVPLPEGGLYINTGTWADLIEFPQQLLVPPSAGTSDPLLKFVRDMEQARLGDYVRRVPTYAHFEIDGDGTVTRAGLHEFSEGASVPTE